MRSVVNKIRLCVRKYLACARLSDSIVGTYSVFPQPPRVVRISYYGTTFHHHLGAWNRLGNT